MTNSKIVYAHGIKIDIKSPIDIKSTICQRPFSLAMAHVHDDLC